MKNVLITDDEHSFLLSLQDGFTVHDDEFTILTAGNGVEAVAILQKSSVDLLVTDLEMPQMNGFELLAWVSRELPQLPVIVMTAFGTPEIESRLAQYDTLQYLEKPLDLETLEKAILDGLNKGSKSYIQGITPAAFLQLLHLEKKSCSLKITSKNGVGYLHLLDGKLVDAEYKNLQGESAAYQIVCWEKTEIEMDNRCQRREGPINMSLESILLDAHRQKDEGGPQTALGQDAASEFFHYFDQDEKKLSENNTLSNKKILSEEIRELLVTRINAHPAVSELALFDQHSNPERSNPGKCSLHVFDPAIYGHLMGAMDENMGLGNCQWISFHTARRSSFLLFGVADYNLLVKLQQGARSQAIAEKISKLINDTLAAGQQ